MNITRISMLAVVGASLLSLPAPAQDAPPPEIQLLLDRASQKPKSKRQDDLAFATTLLKQLQATGASDNRSLAAAWTALGHEHFFIADVLSARVAFKSSVEQGITTESTADAQRMLAQIMLFHDRIPGLAVDEYQTLRASLVGPLEANEPWAPSMFIEATTKLAYARWMIGDHAGAVESRREVLDNYRLNVPISQASTLLVAQAADLLTLEQYEEGAKALDDLLKINPAYGQDDGEIVFVLYQQALHRTRNLTSADSVVVLEQVLRDPRVQNHPLEAARLRVKAGELRLNQGDVAAGANDLMSAAMMMSVAWDGFSQTRKLRWDSARFFDRVILDVERLGERLGDKVMVSLAERLKSQRNP